MEYHVAVICVCLPAVRHLLVRAFPGLDSAPHGSTDACVNDDSGSGAERNVSRSGASRGRGLWSRKTLTDTESERDTVVLSVRRSTGSNDAEQQPADVRVSNSPEKKEGFGLSILDRCKVNGGHNRP